MKYIYVWNDRCGKRFNFSTKAGLNNWVKQLVSEMMDDNPGKTRKELVTELTSDYYVSTEPID